MAITGVEIKKNLERQVNTAYTGGINNALFTYISNRAIVAITEDAYKGIPIQGAYDAISKIIKTAQNFTPNNSQVLLKPLIITGVTIGANCTITFDRPHNLVANTPIVISGVQGVTQANGSFSTYTVPSTNTISLTGVTSTGTYTAGTGKCISSGYIIDDYYHLLAIKAYFRTNLYVSLKKVSASSKGLSITLGYNNNIRNGEYLYFSDFSGLNPINYKYVKKVNNVITLYNDEFLTDIYIPSGTYTSGGEISRIVSNYCKPYNSNEKNTEYVPTINAPRQETNDNRIKVYPIENSLIEQTLYEIDYVSTPISIDPTNAVYDYEQVYNKDFLNQFYVKAGSIFLETIKDTEMFQLLNAGK